MREITIDEAIAHFKDIEGRYRALYTMTRLPEVSAAASKTTRHKLTCSPL